jgi:trans-2,3-dihydro-3-hydroxyanthranilate isomerase
MGIAEDPATGTAAGPLAAFLIATGRAAPNSTLIIEQGHALGRPSRIEVSVHDDQVRVSGSGVVAASGTLAI